MGDSVDYIDQVFGEFGYLAKLLGYKRRDGQVALAMAIALALESGEPLFAEGGTGIGKSFAYLVPVIHYVHTHPGVRAVIVTANISLQEQLVRKDLPALASVLPWPFTYALLKGRNNYLCADRLRDIKDRNGVTYKRLAKSPDDETQIEALIAWGETCVAQQTSGDKSRLPFVPNPKIWPAFSVSGEECKTPQCPEEPRCVVNRERERARQAQIIVTNYDMFFLHMQTGHALPPFDVVVFDECQKAPDKARESFGAEITEATLRRFAARYVEDSDTEREMVLAGSDFFGALEQYFRAGSFASRLRLELARETRHGVGPAWQTLERVMERTRRTLSDRYETCRDAAENDKENKELQKDRDHARRGFDRVCKLLLDMTDTMRLRQRKESRFVYTLEKSDEASPLTIIKRELNVADILKPQLFAKNKVICTSATLSIRGKFDFIRRELGCSTGNNIIAESPFHFASAALLIVPDDMPPPTDETFDEVAAERIAGIIRAANGRTLVLFTSKKSLKRTREHPAIQALEREYALLWQGDYPASQLIEEFKRDTHSCLFGLDTFWAGVDVPGESLSVVVLHRLPFPAPNLPIIEALCEDDANWFRSCSLPRGVMGFKQGFGRAIRTETDRAVIVCLDNRLLLDGKKYDHAFLGSIPRVRRGSRIEEITEFLRKREDMTDEEYYKKVFED